MVTKLKEFGFYKICWGIINVLAVITIVLLRIFVIESSDIETAIGEFLFYSALIPVLLFGANVLYGFINKEKNISIIQLSINVGVSILYLSPLLFHGFTSTLWLVYLIVSSLGVIVVGQLIGKFINLMKSNNRVIKIPELIVDKKINNVSLVVLNIVLLGSLVATILLTNVYSTLTVNLTRGMFAVILPLIAVLSNTVYHLSSKTNKIRIMQIAINTIAFVSIVIYCSYSDQMSFGPINIYFTMYTVYIVSGLVMGRILKDILDKNKALKFAS